MHFQEQEIRTLHSPCSDESALLKEMRIHLFINMYFLLISQQIERDESQMFGPAYTIFIFFCWEKFRIQISNITMFSSSGWVEIL